MARDFFINGETMVFVKGGPSSGSLTSLQQLGLSDGPITVTLDTRHHDIIVNAWGPEIPADVQIFLAAVNVAMTLVHFDRAVLDDCVRESMGGPTAIGQLNRAGTRMGGGVGRFMSGNHYVGLNLGSPVGGVPWRFHSSYLAGPPLIFPVGTERSVVRLTWRVVPYTTDPYGASLGATGQVLWDHTLDT